MVMCVRFAVMMLMVMRVHYNSVLYRQDLRKSEHEARLLGRIKLIWYQSSVALLFDSLLVSVFFVSFLSVLLLSDDGLLSFFADSL